MFGVKSGFAVESLSKRVSWFPTVETNVPFLKTEYPTMVPDLAVAAVHERFTEPELTVPVVGIDKVFAAGFPLAMTAVEAKESGPVPLEFFALTVKETEVPGV